jgi:hypothetical protein
MDRRTFIGAVAALPIVGRSRGLQSPLEAVAREPSAQGELLEILPFRQPSSQLFALIEALKQEVYSVTAIPECLK